MKTAEKSTARYEQIAYQIAKEIVSRSIKESEKLSGRSLLSSKYSVSSETIRKAVELLHNYKVVEVRERSGIFIVSRDNAIVYMESYKKKRREKNHFKETLELLDQSTKLNSELQKKIKKVMLSTKSDFCPFEYFMITIDESSKLLNKTIKDLKLYEKAQAMIIAYEINKDFYQAPSPNTILKAGMKLYILGNLEIKHIIEQYFS